MPEEICNVLNGLRKSIDPTIQKEVENLFQSLIIGCTNLEIEGQNELDEKNLILAILYSCSFCSLEDLKEFLNNYSELLNIKIFANIFIFTYLYKNNEYIKEQIDSCVHDNILIAMISSKKLGPFIDHLGIEFTDAISFINYLKIKTNFMDDVEKLGISIPPTTIKILTDFLNCRKLSNNDKISFGQRICQALGLRKTISSEISQERLVSCNRSINKFYNYLVSSLINIKKGFNKNNLKIKRHNDSIDSVFRLLSTSQEIINVESILNLEASDTEKGILLDYVINHNSQIYEALIEEYETAKRNSDGNLSHLFNSYGFIYASLDSESQSAIKTMKYEQIEKLLIRLNALGLTRIIVPKVDFRKLNEIETQVSRGILNRTWLSENPEILYKENNLFDIVFRNLDALSKDGVNIFQYLDYLDVLKSPLVSNNLNIISTYGLKITKLTHDISFLASESLRKKIEFLYSLGLFQSMESLDILNGSMADCYRLKIANTINVSPSRITVDINNLLCDFSSTVIPESIQKCLRSEEEIIIPLPLELERFQIDNQTLNIMGIFVSSEKVKRNLGKIGDTSADACFYAIIYEGYYTLEEITILRSALVPRNDEEKIVRS